MPSLLDMLLAKKPSPDDPALGTWDVNGALGQTPPAPDAAPPTYGPPAPAPPAPAAPTREAQQLDAMKALAAQAPQGGDDSELKAAQESDAQAGKVNSVWNTLAQGMQARGALQHNPGFHMPGIGDGGAAAELRAPVPGMQERPGQVNAAVAALLQRRKGAEDQFDFGQKQLAAKEALQAKLVDLQKKQALADPKSAETKQKVAALKAVNPMLGMLAERQGMSAAQIDASFPQIKDTMEEGGRNTRDEKDKASAKELEVMREANAEKLKRMEIEAQRLKDKNDKGLALREKEEAGLADKLSPFDAIEPALAEMEEMVKGDESGSIAGHGRYAGLLKGTTQAGENWQQKARALAGLFAQAQRKPGSPIKSPEEILKQYGLEQTSRDDQARAGVKAMRQALTEMRRDALARASPEAQQNVAERRKAAGVDAPAPVADAAPTEVRVLPDGRKLGKFADGTVKVLNGG